MTSFLATSLPVLLNIVAVATRGNNVIETVTESLVKSPLLSGTNQEVTWNSLSSNKAGARRLRKSILSQQNMETKNEVNAVDLETISAETSNIANKTRVLLYLQKMEYLEEITNCSFPTTMEIGPLPEVLKSSFLPYVQGAKQISSTLRNVYFSQTGDTTMTTVERKNLINALVRSLLESSEVVRSVSVIIEDEHQGSSFSRVRGFRNAAARNRIEISNSNSESQTLVATSERTDLAWFWMHRENFSVLLSSRIYQCPEENLLDGVESQNFLKLLNHGIFQSPRLGCSRQNQGLVLSYSLPVLGCNSGKEIAFKGAVKIDIDLSRISIDQCSDRTVFAGTHKCSVTTTCKSVSNYGYRLGGYRCLCLAGYYYPADNATNTSYFNGSALEKHYQSKTAALTMTSFEDFRCLPCDDSCITCDSAVPCYPRDDMALTIIPLTLQTISVIICLMAAMAIFQQRKAKTMRSTFWVLVELIVLGGMLIYVTLIVQYFKATTYSYCNHVVKRSRICSDIRFDGAKGLQGLGRVSVSKSSPDTVETPRSRPLLVLYTSGRCLLPGHVDSGQH